MRDAMKMTGRRDLKIERAETLPLPL